MATKVITFKLDQDLERRLEYHAHLNRLDRSKLIRFILDEYLDDQRLVDLRIREYLSEKLGGMTRSRGWFLDAKDAQAIRELKTGGES